MNTTFTNDALAAWVAGLIEAAKNDEQFGVDLFTPTEYSPVSIVGGWENGFDANTADLFCQSKTKPTYAMCIKIVANEGYPAHCNFETLRMPVDKNGDVEDTCIALEWEDIPIRVAEFYRHEWERLMEAAGEEV